MSVQTKPPILRTPMATVSRPGSATPIVITSFAMKDIEAVEAPELITPMDMEVIMDKLKECDAIKYAAYRTASKLDILRAGLRLDQVKLGAVASAFHQHGFRSTINPDAKFNPGKATDVVADIFFSAGKIRPYFSPTIDVSACTEATVKAVHLIFGENHVGVAFLKVFLTILCEARLKDKLAYLYKDFASADNGLMAKKGIKAFLTELTRISDFLGEIESFGSHLVDSTVAQCLHITNQKLLDEESFFKWIFREPQIIVWLPTFYRLVASKSIRHDVRCANCKSQVIIGMRYQCLQCINYDLCQHCFFYGLTSQSHKVLHPMQEYCYKSTKKEATRALLKMVANNLGIIKATSTGLFKKTKHLRKRYLAHDPEMVLETTAINDDIDEEVTIHEQPVTAESLNLLPQQPVHSEEACSSGFHSVSSQHSQSPSEAKKSEEDLKERQTQLNTILLTMEKENAAVLERLTSLQASRHKIEPVVKVNSSEPELLSQPIHSCVAMQAQLNRLKLLMEGLFGCPDLENGSETPLRSKKQIIDQRQSILMELQNSLNEPSLIESTPIVTAAFLKTHKNLLVNQKKKFSRLALDNNFSPIVFQAPKPVGPLKQTTNMHINTPVFDESVMVDTLLNNDEQQNPNVDSEFPTISKVSLGDITSFLAKTGNHQGCDQDQLNITKLLMTPEEEKELNQSANGDLMEEMDKIMTKMENILATFKDRSLVKKGFPLSSSSQTNLACDIDPAVIGQLVGEISDQIHAQFLKESAYKL